MTVIPLALVATVYAVDHTSRWLASMAAEAMRRADLSQDYVSCVTRIPANKLSEQLAGKAPFTGFCRFAGQELRQETDFWQEFAHVLAESVDRALVPKDLGTLVERLDELVRRPRMLKASLGEDRTSMQEQA